MQQYFSKKIEDNILYLEMDDIHHIKNVMRMKPNDKVIVNYDKVSYMCSLNNDYMSATIESVYKEGTERVYIHAYIPVLSEDKMKFVIEKGTEMEVSEFTPVAFQHSKFVISKDKQDKKIERWNKISKEASEQSRRLIKPKVNDIIKVEDIKVLNGVNVLCSLDTKNVKNIREVLNSETMCDRISLVFGPEGGISDYEEDILESIGFIKTSLGKNVLRTETVIVVVCSIINYING